MPSERSAHEEHNSPGEVQDMRHKVKLAIEHSQASTMNVMRDMMAEFTRNNGRSESGSAEGSAAVGQIPRGIAPAAVRETPAAAVGMARHIAAEQETNLREGASPDLGATGRGELRCLSRLAHQGVSQTSLEGLENGGHTLAVSWVVDLFYLSRAIWHLNILPCRRLVG